MKKEINDKTIESLQNSGHTLHHTAMARGYESRKGFGRLEAYNGKFGEGFKVFRPRWDTSSYVTVEYWVK